MMIEHHTRTTRQVTVAAKTVGMNPPPPMLEPAQQQMIDELNGLSGSAFDAAYLRQQRVAHQQALALHSSFAKDGDTPALRKVAAAAVPIVRQHIDRLKSLPAS